MDLSLFAQAGLTQGEAATLLGVSRLTYIRWLNGLVEPSDRYVRTVKTHLLLTKVAIKMQLLPTALPPPRGNQEARKLAIEQAYTQAAAAVEKLKARKAAG